jgi:hypothetical protein
MKEVIVRCLGHENCYASKNTAQINGENVKEYIFKYCPNSDKCVHWDRMTGDFVRGETCRHHGFHKEFLGCDGTCDDEPMACIDVKITEAEMVLLRMTGKI